MAVNMESSLGPLRLRHPIINASGTFDVLAADRVLAADLFADFPFAAYVPKTVTLKPREGNPPPRLYETAAGLLNSIGLANKGIDAFIADDLPRLGRLPVPLIASIAAEETDGYGRCAGMLDGHDEVAALELNVSCPNVELDGKALGCDPDLTARATAQARAATGKFLIVKLTPNVTDILALAHAAVEAGADCLSVINTVHGMVLDPWTLKPALGHVTGGLSGPAIKPVALRAVYLISRELDVPVIGMGGATSANDVLEFMAAGATAVAVGTASFRDPLLAAPLVQELGRQMELRGIASPEQLVGRSH
ncbi:dihydroorotate dehydrogenase B (NAD(+)), catalytic subunit [bacterium BMS3Abin01]|nr:dihydroorotate dehydrogenase B (NAD(+)), catalytic subunit [bacterium BMS3Abin01]